MRSASLALISALLLAGCGTASPTGVRDRSGPVLRAPSDIVALAREAARASAQAARLPPGAVALPQRSRLLAPPTQRNGAFGDDYAYVNIVEWQGAWRVRATPARILHDVGAGLGPGTRVLYTESSSRRQAPGAGPPQGPTPASLTAIARAWQLDPGNRWFSRRDLVVSVHPASHHLYDATVAARVVWIPRRLRVPRSARAVSIALMPGDRVQARVRAAGELRAIVAAVDALAPDEAVHAVFSCPALGLGLPTVLRLTFRNAAGRRVARLDTSWCPPDATLTLAHHHQLLYAGAAFVRALERITGRRLRVSAL